ncbi:MAG: MFS transporter [Pseudomonadota bacterium]
MAHRLRTICLVIVLWTAGLLAGGQFAKISLFLPELNGIYPHYGSHTAWLLTLVSIVGALFGGVSAGIANRLGLRPVLVFSLVAGGIFSLWQASFPSFGIMAVARVLEGVTHLGIVVTAPAIMAQVSSDRWRGATMALWGTFFGVSFAIFAWFGIPLSSQMGVGGLFQLHGVGMIIVAVIVVVLSLRPGSSRVQGDRDEEHEASLRVPMGDARVLWPALGWLFYTSLYLSLLTILPANLPEALRAEVTTAMSLVGIATGLILFPLLLLRMAATRIVIGAFGLAALISFVGPALGLAMMAVVLFAILGLVQSGTFAAVAQLNNSMPMRTMGFGLMAQTGNMGNLLGTPILLAVLDQFGVNTLLMAVAALYGLGVICLYLLGRGIRNAP